MEGECIENIQTEFALCWFAKLNPSVMTNFLKAGIDTQCEEKNVCVLAFDSLLNMQSGSW